MAILKNIPGLEVTVQVAGTELVEYDADEEETKSLAESTTCPTATKYIQCIDEAEFAIKIVASRRYAWRYKKHSLYFGVHIDGNYAASRVISSPGDTMAINNKIAFCPQSRRWKNYNLKFSAISTTDDSRKEIVAQDREIVKNLGQIKVVVERRVKCGRKRGGAIRRTNPTQKFELAEKAMKGKAISHGTAFLSVGKIRAPRPYYTESLRGDKGPIAVFRFLYRSKDALQKNLIIPRDALPSSGRSFDSLSPTEKERLAKEKFKEIKREKELEDEVKPIIKRKAEELVDLTEIDEIPSPTKRLAHFIDLTLD
ncbi:hypothetical protein F4859DRAFT_68656 [Xylaria cf. heliscus]|nr:hypothetical protein F4859DRAFT_68656 [Xylaria cf. heliscus]